MTYPDTTVKHAMSTQNLAEYNTKTKEYFQTQDGIIVVVIIHNQLHKQTLLFFQSTKKKEFKKLIWLGGLYEVKNT